MKNISVIGIGKLGLCFSLTLERAGYDVIGVDVAPDYVNSINKKTLESSEALGEEYLKSAKNFKATTSVEEAINHSDILFVVVATPSLANGRYDHRQIDNLISEIKDLGPQQREKHFIVSCTTMPGYCDSIAHSLKSLNYVVSYNPEFIAQGTIIRNQANPDMVLIGEGSTQAGDLLEKIYKEHTHNNPQVCRMSPLEAEITKIALNCFLTTKIAYANMVGDIVTSFGGEPNKVLSAIGGDTRIGSKYLGYGYGYGGPCFPRDNRALALCARDQKIDALISVASDESNKQHLQFQINEIVKKENKEKLLTFECVTYKPESTMIVESQQLAIAHGLTHHGFKVKIKERKEVIEQVQHKYGNIFEYEERE